MYTNSVREALAVSYIRKSKIITDSYGIIIMAKCSGDLCLFSRDHKLNWFLGGPHLFGGNQHKEFSEKDNPKCTVNRLDDLSDVNK